MALALALDIRRATNRFPRRGYGELKSQLISAAESVAHTIVEGCGAVSQEEFARFLEMAIKSNMELEGELLMVRAYRLLSTADLDALESRTIDVRKSVISLRKKVIASILDG